MAGSQKRSDIITDLFLKHSNDIFRYAKLSLPSDIDARDVVQETFLRAFRSWDEFRGESDAKTWLFRIARNYIYDLLRKKQRQRIREVSRSEIPYEGSTNLNTIVELEDALSRLHPTYRQVLVLRWIDDMSVPATAAVLGWSEAKVRVTFHRAKRKLEAELRDQPELFCESEGSDVHGTQI